MKISLNWIQDESNVDIKGLGVDKILRKIGSQLGSVEDVIDFGAKYQGIVIAEVVSCEKHPNADKLSVCKLNDNHVTQDVERDENGLVQVVCGAPNVRAGLKVAWLPPGSAVPSSIPDDPFVLSSRELRGIMSNGMIASAHELVISDDHNGILELDDAAEVGRSFADAYGLNDTVIELENKMFTHRPDCFGILGVARELAGITGQQFRSPSWYLESSHRSDSQGPYSEELKLSVKNELQELVPRFMAVAMSGISVGPSPVWLQVLLTKVGIKPINNVVDVTNYIMQLTGQPLHAFDYDKIKELSDTPSIFPRLSNEGEKLTLLGGKEIELTGKEIVISTDKQAVALAGVMGGVDTEVDESTKNIIIECANFNMYSIRRTSMRYGLFTDAVTRFNKGQSPFQNNAVLMHAMTFMTDLAGATQSSPVFDLIDNQISPGSVRVDIDYINDRLGTGLSEDDICNLLVKTEFFANPEDGGIHIGVPFWRMDIEQPEDIVEEVGRLFGYSNIPVVLPSRSISPASRTPLQQAKYNVRQNLLRAGANEVLTYSFVHGDLLRKIGISPDESAYHIRNAISPELQYYRPTLLSSLLAKVHPNIKSQAGSETNAFAIFELGKTHTKSVVDQENLPKPSERLAMVIAADDKTAQSTYGTDSLTNGTAFYLAKRYVDTLTNKQASYIEFDATEHGLESEVANTNRSATVVLDGNVVGFVGEVATKVQKAFKLPAFTAVLSLDVIGISRSRQQSYVPLPKFPIVKQDITLDVAIDAKYSDVSSVLSEKLRAEAKDKGICADVTPAAIFRADGGGVRSLSFKISMWHPSRTLSKQEVSSLLDKIQS